MPAETVFDTKPQPIHWTAEEETEARKLIELGKLPPDYIKQHYEAEARNVFGFDAKKDKHGNWIEEGWGSAKNMSRNSIEAYRKYGSHEPDFEANLQRMEAQLKTANERRAKERLAASGAEI